MLQLNPFTGDHKYVPPPVAVSDVFPPGEIELALVLAVTIGPDICVTLTVWVRIQPFASVTVTE